MPANVGSVGAEGTNGLLRDGALPILKSEDVLAPYLYSYAESLKLEVLPKIGNASQVDMRYLNELGVIELVTSKKTERPTQPKAETLDSQPKHRNHRSRKSSESTQEAVISEQSAGNSAPAAERTRTTPPDEVLSTLSPVQLAVMQAIPDDHGVTADALAALEYPYQEVIAALTMLEILGLVQKLPGAIYVKI